jgi:protein MpaA
MKSQENRPAANTLISQWLSWSKQTSAADVRLREWGKRDSYPLIGVEIGNYSPSLPSVYISAGVHGDEPAGALALIDWVQQRYRELPGIWHLAPLVNPSGWDAGTRENADGIDLNRDYGIPHSVETQQQQRWMESLPPISLFVSLHEDYETDGFYLYCLQQKELGKRIIQAVSGVIPIEQHYADGHPLEDGLVHTLNPDEVVREMGDSLPEALWFYQRYRCLNLTTETPSSRPLNSRIEAQKRVLDTLLEYLIET